MITVYKYVLKDQYEQKVRIYQGARPISVGLQGNKLCVWCIVDTEQPVIYKTFWIFDTGEAIPLKPFDLYYKYIGRIDDGLIVHHVFENLQ